MDALRTDADEQRALVEEQKAIIDEEREKVSQAEEGLVAAGKAYSVLVRAQDDTEEQLDKSLEKIDYLKNLLREMHALHTASTHGEKVAKEDAAKASSIAKREIFSLKGKITLLEKEKEHAIRKANANWRISQLHLEDVKRLRASSSRKWEASVISKLESQLASKVKSVDKYREDRDEWMRKYTEMSKTSLERVRERAALRMECASETMRANRAERALASALDEIKRLSALRNGAQTRDKVPVLG